MKATMTWRCRACDDLVKDYLCVPYCFYVTKNLDPTEVINLEPINEEMRALEADHPIVIVVSNFVDVGFNYACWRTRGAETECVGSQQHRLQATQDPSNLLAHEAVFALGQMQDAEAIPALKIVLNDYSLHPIVRHEAAEALGAIGLESNITLLKDSLESDPAQEVDPLICAEADSFGLVCQFQSYLRYGALFRLRNQGGDEVVAAIIEPLNAKTASDALSRVLKDVNKHPMVDMKLLRLMQKTIELILGIYQMKSDTIDDVLEDDEAENEIDELTNQGFQNDPHQRRVEIGKISSIISLMNCFFPNLLAQESEAFSQAAVCCPLCCGET
ncbi:deoxyhypusine hydroxylase [Tanacetum coccineum]